MYTKQTWVDNVTVIDAARMNHIEEGILKASQEAGKPGENGITPQLKVEGEFVKVSYDEGKGWSNLIPLSSITGPEGATGKAFSVFKTYTSTEEMEADKEQVPEGSFVLITSTEEDKDNAKLFVRTIDGFNFLTDMSGAQGIQGEPGKNGTTPAITVKVITVEGSATVEQTGTAEAPVFTFGIPAGKDGKDGENGITPDITFTVSETDEDTVVVTKGGTAEAPTFNLAFPETYHPDLTDVVRFRKFSAGADPAERLTIDLANADSISGRSSDGTGYNLLMVSKWNKVDVGSSSLTMNLNSKDGVVQINDDKTVATLDDILEATENLVEKSSKSKLSTCSIHTENGIVSLSSIGIPDNGGQTNVSLDSQNAMIMANYKDESRKEAALIHVTPTGVMLKRRDAEGVMHETELVTLLNTIEDLKARIAKLETPAE